MTATVIHLPGFPPRRAVSTVFTVQKGPSPCGADATPFRARAGRNRTIIEGPRAVPVQVDIKVVPVQDESR